MMPKLCLPASVDEQLVTVSLVPPWTRNPYPPLSWAVSDAASESNVTQLWPLLLTA